MPVSKGGRSRWHIENETFNTLKNQDYKLEHNYGPDEQHLATNLAYLTFLTFLVDQIQQLCCPVFQEALKLRARGTRTCLWKLMLRYVLSWLIESREGYTCAYRTYGISLETSYKREQVFFNILDQYCGHFFFSTTNNTVDSFLRTRH